MSTSRQRLPKPSRPSTGNERPSYNPDHHKVRNDTDFYVNIKLFNYLKIKGCE